MIFLAFSFTTNKSPRAKYPLLLPRQWTPLAHVSWLATTLVVCLARQSSPLRWMTCFVDLALEPALKPFMAIFTTPHFNAKIIQTISAARGWKYLNVYLVHPILWRPWHNSDHRSNDGCSLKCVLSNGTKTITPNWRQRYTTTTTKPLLSSSTMVVQLRKPNVRFTPWTRTSNHGRPHKMNTSWRLEMSQKVRSLRLLSWVTAKVKATWVSTQVSYLQFLITSLTHSQFPARKGEHSLHNPHSWQFSC